MKNFLSDPLPEIVFSGKTAKDSQAISRLVKSRRLRKLAPKIYSSNLKDPPHEIIYRNSYLILSKLFPGAVISHRSALEGGFTKDHSIVLSYKYTKTVRYPGLCVYLIKGPGPLPFDMPFLNSLTIASRARAFLENLKVTRIVQGESKTLSKQELETRLEKLIRIYGNEELNIIRDQAKKIAPDLNLMKEAKISLPSLEGKKALACSSFS